MEWQSPTPCQILELRNHQNHEMIDAAASLRGASHLGPSALLYKQYATEAPLYQYGHCGLVVEDTVKRDTRG